MFRIKTLYLTAGLYDAGNATASYTLLPIIWECKEFVNADEIARGLSPFKPEEVVIQAGKLQLERINSLLNSDQTFTI